jgi:hypothetical protein
LEVWRFGDLEGWIVVIVWIRGGFFVWDRWVLEEREMTGANHEFVAVA